jgi:hypothetical protein
MPHIIQGEMAATTARVNGVASIKAEFVLPRVFASNDHDDDLAERLTNPATAAGSEEEDGSANKRVKLSGAAKKRAKKESNRGQNKGRKFVGIKDQNNLCHLVSRGRKCGRSE